ncbi:MAG: GNAT family N-acetyltransferase [Elusimicrobiota bacterium]|jgi:hypothetical protein
MSYKPIEYADVAPGQWDEWVMMMENASHYHARYWVDYCSEFPGIVENCSFVLQGDDKQSVAICPVAVSKDPISGDHELSFGGIPAGCPAIRACTPSFRRRVLDAVFSRLGEIARRHGVKTVKMAGHPLSVACCSGASPSHWNSFEFLRYRMFYYVNNTLVIDTARPETELTASLSKYHRRHINKARAGGFRCQVFDSKSEAGALDRHFQLFQEIHMKSAGRLTRPQSTWDAMLKAGREGKASLFILSVGDRPASFLFCGEFSSMAFGWSQANDKDLEESHSLRHLLEWEAVLHYKSRGIRFYEVGERYHGPQLFYMPSPKEVTISEFKERYGGSPLPKVFWYGFCDQETLTRSINEKTAALVANHPIVQFSQEEEQ